MDDLDAWSETVEKFTKETELDDLDAYKNTVTSRTEGEKKLDDPNAGRIQLQLLLRKTELSDLNE